MLVRDNWRVPFYPRTRWSMTSVAKATQETSGLLSCLYFKVLLCFCSFLKDLICYINPSSCENFQLSNWGF
ncbi:unnamed protein product [Lactuca virosa]|uniref:Uncharacterized protein n=1 Tax=Lactuca virosa TaxID=75947 RepID=A0AAU9LSY7_9ASTR|nr:unnamed protein product [Lactuca virosa]